MAKKKKVKSVGEQAKKKADTGAGVEKYDASKIDKLEGLDLGAQMKGVAANIAKRPAAHPTVLATSARDSVGIDNLRVSLTELV